MGEIIKEEDGTYEISGYGVGWDTLHGLTLQELCILVVDLQNVIVKENQ